MLDAGIVRLGELHRPLMTALHAGGEALTRDEGDHGLADDARGEEPRGQLLLDAPRLPVEHDEARPRVLLEHHQGVEKAQARVPVSSDGPRQARPDPGGGRLLDDVEDDGAAAPDDAHSARLFEETGRHVAELEQIGAALALIDDHDTRRVGPDAGHLAGLESIHRPDRLLVGHVLGHEDHQPGLLRTLDAVAGGVQRVRGRGVVEHEVDVAASRHRLLRRGEDLVRRDVHIGVLCGARRHDPADANAELLHRLDLEAGRLAEAQNADARLLRCGRRRARGSGRTSARCRDPT